MADTSRETIFVVGTASPSRAHSLTSAGLGMVGVSHAPRKSLTQQIAIIEKLMNLDEGKGV